MNNYPERRLISLPSKSHSNWRYYFRQSLTEIKGMQLFVDCNDWNMSCQDLKEIDLIAKEKNNTVTSIRSRFPETIVSASALSFQAELSLSDETNQSIRSTDNSHCKENISDSCIFHKGTLRSGEVLESEGSLMFLGDVNPGAMLCANENIMIWGRLLGTAHAGKSGNINSKISALQLRPLQLRIADKIARGPKEKPEIGIAEQAEIKSGKIVNTPLRT